MGRRGRLIEKNSIATSVRIITVMRWRTIPVAVFYFETPAHRAGLPGN